MSRILRIIYNVIIFLILSATALVFLFPIFISIMRSFTPLTELHGAPETFFRMPASPTARNYADLLFTDFELPLLFPRYFLNSVLVTALVVVLQLWIATPAAYALAKVDFPGAGFLNRLLEAGLLFGGAVLFVNQYVVLNRLRLINTFPALILPLIVTAGVPGVFLMRQFIKQLPDDMIEAARLSGASHARICRDLIIPNIKPARITAGIFALTSAWYTGTNNFVYSEELKMLPSVMTRINAAVGVNSAVAGVAVALATVMMLFPLAAFLIYQKSVINIMAYGGLK